jgi:predicted nucleic acid-binding Zn ribbon protein
LLIAGSAGNLDEIAAAVSVADLTSLQRKLRSERITLWLLMVLVVVNVVLAVWRPKLTFKARQAPFTDV